ncbi:MAG: hypothetical protein IVW36_08195 [Dehalococcoidia bacterium]|nr:hypothetical protein [Dehalococcoidia bacterium]
MTATERPVLEATLTERLLPAHDPAHGTPDPMLLRTLRLRIAGAEARFEQTDYGHPGRFNAWVPRGIDGSLQARAAELQRACDALSRLLL